jgi:hypothetical protein
MALPLAVIPLAAGAAGAAGAGLRAGGAFAEANQMFSDDLERRLAALERRNRAGGLGLTDTERVRMEDQFATQRAQQLASDQSRQLQQAQMLAGGGAVGGREMFLNELATQQSQAQQATEAARQIAQADEREREREQQMLMELQQREADARAARRQAGFNLAADIVSLGATTGVGVAGARQYARGSEQMLGAVAGSQAAREASMKMAQGQMAMSMAGSLTGATGAMPMPAPMPMPMPAPSAAPAAPGAGASPMVNPMMTPVSSNPYGSPTIVGFQQMPDGTMVPVYAQGGV